MTCVPNKAYTHGGVFHADDVFSAALLAILNPRITVERGFRPPEDFDGIVFDVGGSEFDHHGVNKRFRANGVPYASFGLLWEHYGNYLLCEEDVLVFDESFVQPIDDADNGGAFCMLSQLVSDFNPSPPGEPAQYDKAFVDAVTWSQGVLQRRISALREVRVSREYIRAWMSACDGSVLILERLVPWKEAVIGSGYVYVIYPSIRGGYNVQAVPERLGDHSMVLPFPEAWRGKSSDELNAITGINGIEFCHPTGFLCTTNMLESAVEVAHLSLSQNRH